MPIFYKHNEFFQTNSLHGVFCRAIGLTYVKRVFINNTTVETVLAVRMKSKFYQIQIVDAITVRRPNAAKRYENPRPPVSIVFPMVTVAVRRRPRPGVDGHL